MRNKFSEFAEKIKSFAKNQLNTQQGTSASEEIKMNILSKTRGDSPASGKMNIWYCRLGEGDEIFSAITEDILSRVDCAIFYEGDCAQDVLSEEMRLILSEMKLVVVPIAFGHQSYKSRMAEDIINYARENSIPLLPILTESGLAPSFNKKFDGIQYIDRVTEDDTAISYGEKLTAFLKENLYGDELMFEIRGAFKDSLFLSYRKKDRKYINELMRAVHRDEKLSDVAIWYDEYLTPGENFNSSIDRELKNSCAMLLAVTPSLLEEGNYVCSVEYPRALEYKKPVLPIELARTDSEELRRLYPDIPMTLGRDESRMLTEILQKMLGRTEKKEHTKRERYLYALAYSGGVGVERDTEHAGEILFGLSAELLPEAMESLAGIYRYGDGVKADFSRAESWYRRAGYVYLMLLSDTPTDEIYRSYIRTAENAAALAAECTKYRTAREYLTDAIYKVSDDFFEREPDAKARLLETSGLMEKKAQNYFEARLLYERAYEIRKKLPETKENSSALISLSYRIGDLLRIEDNLDSAEKYYKDACLMAEELSEKYYEADVMRLCCIVVEKLGDLSAAQGRGDEAIGYYKDMRDAALDYSDLSRTLYSKRMLAIALERLGYAATEAGDISFADETLKESLDIRREIDQASESYESKRDLSVIYIAIGKLCRKAEDYENAERFYVLARDINDALKNEYDTVESRFDSGVISEALGDLFDETDDFAGALIYYMRADETYQSLEYEDTSIEVQRAAAIISDKLGRLYFNTDMYDEAKEKYQNALYKRKSLFSRYNTPTLKRDVAISYGYLRNVALMEGDIDKYTEYAALAVDPVPMENRAYSSNARIDDTEFIEQDGTFAFDEGDYEEAIRNYTEVLNYTRCGGPWESSVSHMEMIAIRYMWEALGGVRNISDARRVWSILADNCMENEDYVKIISALDKM